MKKIISFILCLTIIFGCCTNIFAADKITGTTIKLTKTSGTVSVVARNGKSKNVKDNMKLLKGYTVTTGKRSYAYISIDKSKYIKLDASTEVEIIKSGKKLEVFVNSGEIFFDVSEKISNDESFTIRTNTMITGIHGTIGICGDKKLVLLEGAVDVYDIETETITPVSEGYIYEKKEQPAEDPQNPQDPQSPAPQEPPEEVTLTKIETAEEIPGFATVALKEDENAKERVAEVLGEEAVETAVEKAEEKLEADEVKAEEEAKIAEAKAKKEEEKAKEEGKELEKEGFFANLLESIKSFFGDDTDKGYVVEKTATADSNEDTSSQQDPQQDPQQQDPQQDPPAPVAVTTYAVSLPKDIALSGTTEKLIKYICTSPDAVEEGSNFSFAVEMATGTAVELYNGTEKLIATNTNIYTINAVNSNITITAIATYENEGKANVELSLTELLADKDHVSKVVIATTNRATLPAITIATDTNLEITGSVLVPSGTSIVNYANLTVSELYNYGTFVNKGTVTISGILENNGVVSDTGMITTAGTGTINKYAAESDFDSNIYNGVSKTQYIAANSYTVSLPKSISEANLISYTASGSATVFKGTKFEFTAVPAAGTEIELYNGTEKLVATDTNLYAIDAVNSNITVTAIVKYTEETNVAASLNKVLADTDHVKEIEINVDYVALPSVEIPQNTSLVIAGHTVEIDNTKLINNGTLRIECRYFINCGVITNSSIMSIGDANISTEFHNGYEDAYFGSLYNTIYASISICSNAAVTNHPSANISNCGTIVINENGQFMNYGSVINNSIISPMTRFEMFANNYAAATYNGKTKAQYDQQTFYSVSLPKIITNALTITAPNNGQAEAGKDYAFTATKLNNATVSMDFYNGQKKLDSNTVGDVTTVTVSAVATDTNITAVVKYDSDNSHLASSLAQVLADTVHITAVEATISAVSNVDLQSFELGENQKLSMIGETSAASVKFTNNVTISGILESTCTITNDGTMTVTANGSVKTLGGKLVNNANKTISNAGILYFDKTGILSNSGTITTAGTIRFSPTVYSIVSNCNIEYCDEFLDLTKEFKFSLSAASRSNTKVEYSYSGKTYTKSYGESPIDEYDGQSNLIYQISYGSQDNPNFSFTYSRLSGLIGQFIFKIISK